MKKRIVTLLAGAMLAVSAMFAVVTPASAYSISKVDIEGSTYIVDIGGLDTLIASGQVFNDKNKPTSGDADEVAWVNTALNNYYNVDTFNFTQEDLTKYDTPSSSGWVNTNEYTADAPVVAFELETAPAFYYIKTGNVGDYDHFLFANNESFDWAVVNLKESFGTGYVINGIGKFSHNGELGDTTPVPEPGTMVLLGAGMLGLAIFGKRRMNRD